MAEVQLYLHQKVGSEKEANIPGQKMVRFLTSCPIKRNYQHKQQFNPKKLFMNHNQNDEAVYCIRFANFKPVDFFSKRELEQSKERLGEDKEIELDKAKQKYQRRKWGEVGGGLWNAIKGEKTSAVAEIAQFSATIPSSQHIISHLSKN